ncbi:MAG TPA: F0F1 ATP synthase subunit epsilon [Candidatus Paceibacterota bacterium]
MKLYIYSIDKIIYEGEADILTIPSETGELSVLPNHAPIVTTLKSGKISIQSKSGNQNIPIQSGFAEVNQTQTILLVK